MTQCRRSCCVTLLALSLLGCSDTTSLTGSNKVGVRVIGQTADGQNEVRCDDLANAKPTVFLAFGQSIAANFNETAYQPRGAVYSIDAGRCFQARDPMRGAEGSMGSMWSRVGEEVTPTLFPISAFLTIGVGGASITRWDVGGDLHPRLTAAIDALVAQGFGLDYILWHQGSADRGMSASEYMNRFKNMIGSLSVRGVHAGLRETETRILVAVHTVCGSSPDNEIAAGQRGLVDEQEGFFAGANTDTLGAELRFDGCHLSEAGTKAAAGLWATALRRAAEL